MFSRLFGEVGRHQKQQIAQRWPQVEHARQVGSLAVY